MGSLRISQDLLKEHLSYDPETGVIRRKVKTINSTSIGAPVIGRPSAYGYLRINLLGNRWLQHRLAWIYVYGDIPEHGYEIDHINQNKMDNRICNLRLVTRSANVQNKGKQSNNKCGVKNVWKRKDTGKWTALIAVDKKRIRLGCFDSLELAAAAAELAREQYHPYRPTDDTVKT